MEQNAQRELFETLPIPKAVAKLMLPTIIGSLVMVLYNLADTYFVGLLNDPVQNAAVTFVAPLMLAFNAVNNLFGVGSSSLMSRSLGLKEYDTVRKTSAIGIYCSVFCGLMITLLCLAFEPFVLKMIGVDASTAKATAGYMRWAVTCGAVPSIVNVVFGYLFRSEGAALHASIGTMSGCLLNIILDPIMILGLGMGAAGAGLATFLSNCFACTYFLVLMRIKRGKTFIRIHPKYFRPNRRILSGIFGVGIPAAIQNLLNVTGMTILNNIAASYGTSVVASIGIAQKIYQIPMQVALGGGQGVMPLVGYNFSSKNYRRMSGTIRFLLSVMVPVMVAVAVGMWLASGPLIGIFMKNSDIIHYGGMFLKAMSIALPFLVVDFIIVGVFQSIGYGTWSLIFAVLRKIVFEIPAILILNKCLGVDGIAYGAFVAELLLAFIGSVVLLRILRRLLKSSAAASAEKREKF